MENKVGNREPLNFRADVKTLIKHVWLTSNWEKARKTHQALEVKSIKLRTNITSDKARKSHKQSPMVETGVRQTFFRTSSGLTDRPSLPGNLTGRQWRSTLLLIFVRSSRYSSTERNDFFFSWNVKRFTARIMYRAKQRKSWA